MVTMLRSIAPTSFSSDGVSCAHLVPSPAPSSSQPPRTSSSRRSTPQKAPGVVLLLFPPPSVIPPQKLSLFAPAKLPVGVATGVFLLEWSVLAATHSTSLAKAAATGSASASAWSHLCTFHLFHQPLSPVDIGIGIRASVAIVVVVGVGAGVGGVEVASSFQPHQRGDAFLWLRLAYVLQAHKWPQKVHELHHQRPRITHPPRTQTDATPLSLTPCPVARC